MVQSLAKNTRFVSTSTVASWMESSSKNLVVLSCCATPPQDAADVTAKHASGHIPGAKLFNLHLLKDQTNPLPFMMPNAMIFRSMMQALGIKKTSTVVTYEKGGMGVWATRFAFTLRAYGHTNVFILDGHYKKWEAENRAVETDEDQGGYDYTLQENTALGYEDIKNAQANGDRQILDQRSPEQVQQMGAIDKALMVPLGACFNEDGTVKDKEALEAVLTGAGVDLSKPVVTSCMGGVQATAVQAAVEHHFYTESGKAAVYDGSWSEYSQKEKN